ncbi:DUF3052 family protein [Parvularcula mediterranea]|uniref:DUF3052 family protein n=1 Tax=Parvularcula mediterranea TaxID=2732508 RepID=UPI0018E9D970|nr:DUF3052 family protein [Parvularcula mediterranea]
MTKAGASHGYSGKPLAEKLGMKPGTVVLPIGAPAHYRDLLPGTDDVIFRKTAKSADIVHLFCRHRADLARRLPGALGKVAGGGMLWISWPKKSSPLFKDLTEGDLRTAILPTTNFVDVKVCAVDEDWSALKFLRRKA